MSRPGNILFIMLDQLRADYLGCTGHPSIKTPNIDALAAKGVNFSRAYTQGTTCGSARASFYTGRYSHSHGATYNGFPLNLSQRCFGHYLKPLGYRVALVGKTHMKADRQALIDTGADLNSPEAQAILNCDFEEFERDDGLHPDEFLTPGLRYNQYLNDKGYHSHNPWSEFANSVEDERGEVHSGWQMRHVHHPARVREEHSESAYMTDRALEFIDCASAQTQPWCLHLSYIKPHWPYVAPAPYHKMYSAEDVPVVRDQDVAPLHPLHAAFRQHREAKCFSDDTMRRHVIPTYMGLISQIDHHVGRVVAHLDNIGQLDNTLIVLTSDHGDYLGDHQLGEKELFHEPSVKIPMIVVDPKANANASRGTIDARFVEAIDLVPTFVDWAGGTVPTHKLEGRSLLPLLHCAGERTIPWRDYVISECDYCVVPARAITGDPVDQCKGVMIRGERWKYISYQSHRPQLFDLLNDPHEYRDLAQDSAYSDILVQMQQRLLHWYSQLKFQQIVATPQLEALQGRADQMGMRFGVW